MSVNGLLSQSLSLNPAIDTNFLTVEVNTSVREVLTIMSHLSSYDLSENKQKINQTESFEGDKNRRLPPLFLREKALNSCVLVTQDHILIGIFTERDLVNLTANQIELDNLIMKDVITKQPISLQYSEGLNIFNALSILYQHKIRHLPIVNFDRKPIGMITYETIRKSLKPVNLLTRVHSVTDVMEKNVICAKANDSLLTIVELMSFHKISSVIIVEEKDHKKVPIGIISEKDIVKFHALKLNLAQSKACEFMSSPLCCLLPNASLWEANQMMNERKIRRLAITDHHGELKGIVTQSNLLKILNPTDMYGVIEILESMIEAKTDKLEKANQSLLKELSQRKRSESQLLMNHKKLQEEVNQRTQELMALNQKLQADIAEREKAEIALRKSEQYLKKQAEKMQETLNTLQNTQLKLIQTEKMSSVGQLVAGIAHEINNPVNFIYGNITYVQEYVTQILELLELYHQDYPKPSLDIENKLEEIELDFLKEDLDKILKSMKIGAERIRDLVISLRNFSRLNESQMKIVNIHEGLDNTLLILQNQLMLKGTHQGIQVMKEYTNLPEIECYPGQLNQVFMNIISNAIDSLQESFIQNKISPLTIEAQTFNFPMILIKTEQAQDPNYVLIKIIDNGQGMTEESQKHLFNPFFTTKPIGKGTGLGLSISYQIIVEHHKGSIKCLSEIGKGTEFIIKIPKRQTKAMMWPL